MILQISTILILDVQKYSDKWNLKPIGKYLLKNFKAVRKACWES